MSKVTKAVRARIVGGRLLNNRKSSSSSKHCHRIITKKYSRLHNLVFSQNQNRELGQVAKLGTNFSNSIETKVERRQARKSVNHGRYL